MGIRVRSDGVVRTPTRMRAWDGGTVRSIRRVRVYFDDEVKTVATFAPPLSLSFSPAAAVGTEFSDFPVEVQGGPVVATPAGGASPYSYAWTIVAGTGFTITAPTLASTAIRATVNPLETKVGTARCAVTDAFGNTATADCPISLRNRSPF